MSLKMKIFLSLLMVFLGTVTCDEQKMRIYTRLNINEESVDLLETGKKIVAYYKDKCTFYCSTIDRSINNEYDDSESSDSAENADDEIESESVRFEWYINDKNMDWNQNHCVLDYDDIVKTRHVSALNVTCKVMDETESMTYQFPRIFLDIFSTGRMKNDFDFMREKYEQQLKVATIGFIICAFATVKLILVAYWAKRKTELSENSE